jgi:hypothetical protein
VTSLRRFIFGLVVALGLLSITASVRADASRDAACPELPCSVNRSCSSTGVACDPDDRACTEGARAKDLEVRCEQQCSDTRRLVYCPPDTGRADSNVVWILLAAATVLAIAGSALLWAVLRKKGA